MSIPVSPYNLLEQGALVDGTGAPSAFSGDGGPAMSAGFFNLFGVAVDAQGNLYIADTYNHRIRKVTTDGIVRTIAGNGASGFSGDNGPATQAQLNEPYAVTVDPAGNGTCTSLMRTTTGSA